MEVIFNLILRYIRYLKTSISSNTSIISNTGAQLNQQVCTYKAFLDCKPLTFTGVEGAVGLLRWIEKMESVFTKCKCLVTDRVGYATGTLEGVALTWWNSQVQMLGLDEANTMAWDEFKGILLEEYCPCNEMQKLEFELWDHKMVGSEIEAYTSRFHELARLCPHMVVPAYKKIELYVGGLAPQIKGMVTSSNPTTTQQAIRLAHTLTDQAVARGTLPKRGPSGKDHATRGNGTITLTSVHPQHRNNHANLNLQEIIHPATPPAKHRVPMQVSTLSATSATSITILDRANSFGARDARKWATRPRIAGLPYQLLQHPKRTHKRGAMNVASQGNSRGIAPNYEEMVGITTTTTPPPTTATTRPEPSWLASVRQGRIPT